MARGRQRNVEIFEAMYLSLGPDVLNLAGTSHDAELAEAKASAAARWSRLLDLESQVQREEQALAVRPRKRPAAPGDMLANEVIKRLESAFAMETDGKRAAFAELKEQAKRERKQLESFRR